MYKERIYNFGELCEALKKSANEFKPRKGDGVDREDKKNNEKAVKDILNDVDSVVKTKGKGDGVKDDSPNTDYNSTTLEYRFDTKPPKAYTDRVSSLAKGFSSVDNEKNSDMEDEGGLSFEGNREFLKKRKGISNEKEKQRELKKTGGLKTSKKIEQGEDKDKYKSHTALGENRNMKRLHFKNTKFLSESHMLSKVPDCYKTDGNVFMMRDITGTDYIVECKVDSEYDYTKLNVLGKRNKSEINEELKKIKSLYNYNSKDTLGGLTPKNRVDEGSNMSELLNKTKGLINE